MDRHPLLRILREAYGLLTLIARHHPPTRLLLRAHLNFFLDHSSFKLRASDLVRVLVQDSADAAEALHTHHIQVVIGRLNDPVTRDRILRVQFLKSLVSVEDGVLVKRNQMVVLRGLCEHPSVLGLLRRLDDEQQLRRFVNIANSDTDE